jgi:capsid protein
VEETNTLPLVITSISAAANGDVSLTWNSREGQTYAILAKDNLNESDISLWDELDGSIESQGASTTAVISSGVITSITDTGRIFFRVRVEEENTVPLVITSISTAANGDVLLTWNSREGQTYAILANEDLNESDTSLWNELDGSIESQGASTTAVISSEVVHSITETGKIFFRVRERR